MLPVMLVFRNNRITSQHKVSNFATLFILHDWDQGIARLCSHCIGQGNRLLQKPNECEQQQVLSCIGGSSKVKRNNPPLEKNLLQDASSNGKKLPFVAIALSLITQQ